MCECKREIKLDIVCRDKAYAPTYANSTDFCMDLKAKVDKVMMIAPHSCVTVGTGVQVKIPEGYGMLIAPRSSTGFKLHCSLENTLGIIDSGYRDEIKICLRNNGDTPVTVSDKQRLCQLFIIPKYSINLNFVEDNEDFRSEDRGGGIGSTGIGGDK